MPVDENADILLRWFAALNTGEIALLDRLADGLFTGDFVWHDPRLLDSGRGPDVVKRFIRQLLHENTGVHVTVEDIFSNGDKTASRFNVVMTNTASGALVKVQLIAIDRFVGGKIAEEWQLSAAGEW